jgi:hypothetical protein
MEQLGSHWTDFNKIWYLSIFRKSVEKLPVSLKSDKNKGVLYMKTFVHVWYFAEFFLEWEMFQTKVVEKIKTRILCSITFFRKSCRLWDNVEKYGTARQATDDNKTGSMHTACWISKATDRHSEYVILIAFYGNNGYANAPQYYVIVHCLSCSIYVTSLHKVWPQQIRLQATVLLWCSL